MEIQQLSTRGLTFGLHIVAATSRWADFRAAMRDMFGSRLELRLGDPLDSEIDRRIAALVPQGRPGRGLVVEQAALPHRAPAHRRRGVARRRSATGSTTWSRGSPRRGPARPDPSCGCCPSGSPSTTSAPRPAYRPTLPDEEKGAHPLLVGIDEKELAPVSLDPDTEPHLLVLGDGQSGKSSILRGLAREIMRTRTPQQAQLVVVDYRRALLGEVPDEYLLNYLTSANQAAAGAARPRDVPREPHPRPRRHPRAAAQPLVVDRRRGVRAGRRLRPGRHPAELTGRRAAAAAGPGPRRRPARDRGPPLRRCLARALRAGDPVAARPGHAGPDALGQPRRGAAARQPARRARPARPRPARSPASAASRSCRWPGPTRRSELAARPPLVGRPTSPTCGCGRPGR